MGDGIVGKSGTILPCRALKIPGRRGKCATGDRSKQIAALSGSDSFVTHDSGMCSVLVCAAFAGLDLGELSFKKGTKYRSASPAPLAR